MALPRLTNSCPRCEYVRQASDRAPDWQCPQCGVAYAKVQQEAAAAKSGTTHHVENSYGKNNLLHRVFTISVLLSVLLFVLAWWRMGKLPDADEVLPVMQNSPVQKNISKNKFVFSYRGEKYNVVPVADYELWGLVVSHNNIFGWTDIMHDENSVDIKDICVIWGSNVQDGDYQKVSYTSGDFTCFFRYPYGVTFAHDELSNNHLLSDNPFVRVAIRNAKIGDQIHLKGMLVNYSPQSNPRWWRNSSTVRTDKGNGACEVIFVDKYNVLKSSNSHWYALYNVAKWLIVLTIVIKLVSYYYLPIPHRHA